MGIDLSELMLPPELMKASDQVRLRLLQRDLDKEEKRRGLKAEWMSEWTSLFLKEGGGQWATVLGVLKQHGADKVQAGIVLVELINFSPYVPLKPSAAPSEDQKKTLKELAKCKLDDDVRKAVLSEVSAALGFPADYPGKLESAFKHARHELQGGWTKTIAYAAVGAIVIAIGAAIAATGIGAAVGAAMGLQGAAAVAAGLAFLGGGSIAAGGFGMAGGFAVVVMGGGALGAGAGLGGKAFLDSLTKEAALNETAKMRVIMDEVVVQHQKDVRIHHEVLRRQREAIAAMNARIDELSIDLAAARKKTERDKEEVKRLEKRIDEMGEIVSMLELSAKMGRKTLVAHAVQ